MITPDLARRLRDAGVLWEPAAGDRFTIQAELLEGQVFWVSDLTVEVQSHYGQPLLGFNGTTEWALDSVTLDEALWLPREDQLRELIGDRLVTLTREEDHWVVATTTSRSAHTDVECAYATALLELSEIVTPPG